MFFALFNVLLDGKFFVDLLFIFLCFTDKKAKARLDLFANRRENVSRLRREATQAQEECKAHKRKLQEIEEENSRLTKR